MATAKTPQQFVLFINRGTAGRAYWWPAMAAPTAAELQSYPKLHDEIERRVVAEPAEDRDRAWESEERLRRAEGWC